jgi:hypothetical protein
MGLPVIASDIEAHRELPITTTNNVWTAIEKLHEQFVIVSQGKSKRTATIFDWDLQKFIDVIRADLQAEYPSPYR